MGNLSTLGSRLEPIEWELSPAPGGVSGASKMALKSGIYSADVAQLVERELPKLQLNENGGERRLNCRIAIWLCRAVSLFCLRLRFSLCSSPFAWILTAAVGFLLGKGAAEKYREAAVLWGKTRAAPPAGVCGRDFGADAAAGTLLGLAALTAFVVVYGPGRGGSRAGPERGGISQPVPSLRSCSP
jgi:hypothetical protein